MNTTSSSTILQESPDKQEKLGIIALKELGSAVSAVQDKIEVLIQQLDPICSPVPASQKEMTAAVQAREYPSYFAEIRAQSLALDKLAAEIETLTASLEIRPL